MAVIQGNQMSKCNQGRAAAVYGINIQRTGSSNGAYPAPSNKVIISGNKSDAAVRIFNENSIPVTAVEDDSGLGSSAIVQNTDDHATFEVKTTTGATHSASISVEVDSTANDLLDQKYRLATGVDNNNDFQIQTWYNNAWLTSFRVFPDSSVIFGPATSSALGGFRVKKTFWFDLSGTFAGVVTMSNDLLLEGINVKDKLDSISAPELIRVDAHQTPGGVENWNRMGDGTTCLIHDSTGTTRQRLPVNPVDGQQIDIFCSSGGTINLHTGYDRPFHSASTGLSGTHQCNLNNLGAQMFRVVYIGGEDEWLLI